MATSVIFSDVCQFAADRLGKSVVAKECIRHLNSLVAAFAPRENVGDVCQNAMNGTLRCIVDVIKTQLLTRSISDDAIETECHTAIAVLAILLRAGLLQAQQSQPRGCVNDTAMYDAVRQMILDEEQPVRPIVRIFGLSTISVIASLSTKAVIGSNDMERYVKHAGNLMITVRNDDNALSLLRRMLVCGWKLSENVQQVILGSGDNDFTRAQILRALYVNVVGCERHLFSAVATAVICKDESALLDIMDRMLSDNTNEIPLLESAAFVGECTGWGVQHMSERVAAAAYSTLDIIVQRLAARNKCGRRVFGALSGIAKRAIECIFAMPPIATPGVNTRIAALISLLDVFAGSPSSSADGDNADISILPSKGTEDDKLNAVYKFCHGEKAQDSWLASYVLGSVESFSNLYPNGQADTIVQHLQRRVVATIGGKCDIKDEVGPILNGFGLDITRYIATHRIASMGKTALLSHEDRMGQIVKSLLETTTTTTTVDYQCSYLVDPPIAFSEMVFLISIILRVLTETKQPTSPLWPVIAYNVLQWHIREYRFVPAAGVLGIERKIATRLWKLVSMSTPQIIVSPSDAASPSSVTNKAVPISPIDAFKPSNIVAAFGEVFSSMIATTTTTTRPKVDVESVVVGTVNHDVASTSSSEEQTTTITAAAFQQEVFSNFCQTVKIDTDGKDDEDNDEDDDNNIEDDISVLEAQHESDDDSTDISDDDEEEDDSEDENDEPERDLFKDNLCYMRKVVQPWHSKLIGNLVSSQGGDDFRKVLLDTVYVQLLAVQEKGDDMAAVRDAVLRILNHPSCKNDVKCKTYAYDIMFTMLTADVCCKPALLAILSETVLKEDDYCRRPRWSALAKNTRTRLNVLLLERLGKSSKMDTCPLVAAELMLECASELSISLCLNGRKQFGKTKRVINRTIVCLIQLCTTTKWPIPIVQTIAIIVGHLMTMCLTNTETAIEDVMPLMDTILGSVNNILQAPDQLTTQKFTQYGVVWCLCVLMMIQSRLSSIPDKIVTFMQKTYNVGAALVAILTHLSDTLLGPLVDDLHKQLLRKVEANTKPSLWGRVVGIAAAAPKTNQDINVTRGWAAISGLLRAFQNSGKVDMNTSISVDISGCLELLNRKDI